MIPGLCIVQAVTSSASVQKCRACDRAQLVEEIVGLRPLISLKDRVLRPAILWGPDMVARELSSQEPFIRGQ